MTSPLSVPVGIGSDPEASKEYTEALTKQLAALENRGGTNWFNIAAAFADPGRTGSFGESFGKAMGVVGKQQEEEEARALPIAQMRAQLAGQKYQLTQDAKSQEMIAGALGGMSLQDISQSVSTPQGAIANPAVMQRLAAIQAAIPPGSKYAEQLKNLIDTQNKMLEFGLKSGQLTNDQVKTYYEGAKIADTIPGFKTPSFPSQTTPQGSVPTNVSAPQDGNTPRSSGMPTFEGTSMPREKITDLLTNYFGVKTDQLSTTRTKDEQQSLFDRWKAGDKNVYMPEDPSKNTDKKEFHVNSLDVPKNVPETLMNQLGWYRPFKNDPVHYEPINSRGKLATSSSVATNTVVAEDTSKPANTVVSNEDIPKELATEIARIKSLGLGDSAMREAIKEASLKYTSKTTEEDKSLLQHEREVLRSNNKEFYDSTQKPLNEAVRIGNQAYIANERALKVLDSTKVGPGTSLGMELTKIKDFAIGLDPKQMDDFVKQKFVTQAQAEAVAAGVKAAFGGNLSNKETDRFIMSLYNINDPKEFIRAALQMQIYGHKLNQDLLSTVNNIDATKVDKNKVFSAYWASGKPMELLKKHAPSVANIISEAPTIDTFLAAAKEKNPGATDQQLIDYYNQKYGKN